MNRSCGRTQSCPWLRSHFGTHAPVLFKLLTVACLCMLLVPVATAQQEVDERPLLDVQDGISIRKDSLFLLNLRFRIQNRLGFTSLAGDDLSPASVDARVRRLRLRLDGFVLNRRIQYYIQLSFSKADLELEGANVPQPVRDAMVYYTFGRRFYMGFGQSKLPGNRQRVISSGNLQFAERSFANALYTIDRDFGLFGYYTQPMGTQVLQVKGAFTTGDGRGASPGNAGMAYTGRVEWLPMGVFSNVGDYSEGDLEFEETPKLSLAATYSTNERAYRSGGQLGAELFEERDMQTFIADMMFKYRGWAVLAEYFDRRCDDPVTRSPEGLISSVPVGSGANMQLSRYFHSGFELAARYNHVLPGNVPGTATDRMEEVLLGTTRYLNGHRIKAQFNVGYRWLNGLASTTAPGNSWSAMFQVEFGI